MFAVIIEDADDMEAVTNPLDEVKAGLLDSSGKQLPLQAVHVKCKLMDLLSQVRKERHRFCFSVLDVVGDFFFFWNQRHRLVSPPQVVIFQKYTNRSAVPIEAKYVFPLGECAAVCGFEAFINGKHVVGQVTQADFIHLTVSHLMGHTFEIFISLHNA